MSGPFTARNAVAAHASEALALHKAKVAKYHLRAGGEYLHWSASKLTTNRAHAWEGTMDQARNCRRTFATAAGCKLVALDDTPHHHGAETP